MSDEDFDRKWYSHTPNYFFPKIERYPDLKTATIVFFASSLGIHSSIQFNSSKVSIFLIVTFQRAYCGDISINRSAI